MRIVGSRVHDVTCRGATLNKPYRKFCVEHAHVCTLKDSIIPSRLVFNPAYATLIISSKIDRQTEMQELQGSPPGAALAQLTLQQRLSKVMLEIGGMLTDTAGGALVQVWMPEHCAGEYIYDLCHLDTASKCSQIRRWFGCPQRSRSSFQHLRRR